MDNILPQEVSWFHLEKLLVSKWNKQMGFTTKDCFKYKYADSRIQVTIYYYIHHLTKILKKYKLQNQRQLQPEDLIYLATRAMSKIAFFHK